MLSLYSTKTDNVSALEDSATSVRKHVVQNVRVEALNLRAISRLG